MSEISEMLQLKQEYEEKFAKVLEALNKDFASLRLGRANPQLLDNVYIEAYGDKVKLQDVATISVPDARTLLISVWDKSLVNKVEASIFESNLGVTPLVDGVKIKLHLAPLTEERRKEVSNHAGEFAEKAKIAIRQLRKHFLDKLKSLKKDKLLSEDEYKAEEANVEKEVKKFIVDIDRLLDQKCIEIMKI